MAAPLQSNGAVRLVRQDGLPIILKGSRQCRPARFWRAGGRSVVRSPRCEIGLGLKTVLEERLF
jgi:hypothetical protein